jgi:hypothetical protein
MSERPIEVKFRFLPEEQIGSSVPTFFERRRQYLQKLARGAVRQSLFRPGSGDLTTLAGRLRRDFGHRLNFFEVRFAQVNGRGRNNLFHLLRLARADDGASDGRVKQRPGDCHGSR